MRLPSHFLLPFTTTIERQPAAIDTQTPKFRARLQPGRSADFAEETLAQGSHVLNRQDLVRHLSRKKHWTNLITERQKEKFASMARRSASSHKLVQDHWVWEDQVDSTTAMLEMKVITAVKRAVETGGHVTCSSPSATGEDKFALAFDRNEAGDVGAQAETGRRTYGLTTLLSTESLNVLRRELAPSLTDMVYVPKTPEACQAELALDRLKSYKQFNEVQRDLPQVQNPPGAREARLRRHLVELESPALSDGGDEVNDVV